MQQRNWLAGLVVGSVVIAGALLGAACNDDADSPGEVRETAQDGIGDAGETAEDLAGDAKDNIGDAGGTAQDLAGDAKDNIVDAVDGDETATPTP
jgi:uncharacterized protein YjbJ (UPF0337 family)